MRAAKAWGLNPRTWRAESVDDRALMLSIFLFEATLEAKRADHRNKIMEEEDKKNNGDRKRFDRMRDRL